MPRTAHEGGLTLHGCHQGLWRSGLVCVVGLAFACASLPERTSLDQPLSAARVRDLPDDDDLLAVVPTDAEVVLSLDVAQLRQSRWTGALLAAQAEGGRAQDSGFDELTDVDRLVYARLFIADGAGDGQTLTVAQGRFVRERVRAAFAGRHPTMTENPFRGCVVWSDKGRGLALLTQRTLLSGPIAAVRAAIDASLGRAAAMRSQRWLAEVIAALEQGRGSSSKPPALLLAIAVAPQMRERLRAELAGAEVLEQVGARIDLGQALSLVAVGMTRTRQEASNLSVQLDDTVRHLRARTSLAALGLGPVLEGARIAPQGARVIGDLRLDEAQREIVAERLALLARTMAGAQLPAK